MRTFVAGRLKYTAEKRARRGAAADMVGKCCKDSESNGRASTDLLLEVHPVTLLRALQN